MMDDKSTLVFDIDAVESFVALFAAVVAVAAEAFVVLFAAVAAADNQY